MRVRTAPIKQKRDYVKEQAQRLRQVAERFSLSEIARRTGYPVSCVHSYLNGTRIPAELFSQLVEHFNVSAQWLHTGEGAPFTSDVDPKTASMAADVLALVQAMESVAKLRLGAISGAQPLVRELDEALARHEELRGKLASKSRVVLYKLVEDSQLAMHERRFDAVQAQLATAARFIRLCDDPQLWVQFKNQEAMLARFQNRPQVALAGYRESFVRVLAERDTFGADCFVVAFNYSNALQVRGELRESASVCDAMLSLGGKEPPLFKRAALEFQRGWLDILMGELRQGLDRMGATLPLTAEDLRPRIEAPRFMAAQLYAGIHNLNSAAASIADSAAKGGMLAYFAAWEEDLDKMEAIVEKHFGGDERFTEDARGRLSNRTPLGQFVVAFLRALKHKDRQAARSYEEGVDSAALPGEAAFNRFSISVNSCQLTRLAGGTMEARRKLEAAEICFRELSAGVSILPLDLARHYHNALTLAPDSRQGVKLRKRARQFFSEWIGRGYLCFRKHARV